MTDKEQIKISLQRCLYIFWGTVIIVVAINMFFKPNNIVVGGFSGLGIIIERLFGIKMSVLNITLNIPFLIIAYKVIGKRYVLSTIIATSIFSFLLEYINFLPTVENDLFLASVFGGIINGIGIGLVLKGRGSTGGIDLISVLIHSAKREIPVSGIMMFINSIIVIAGMCLFGMEKAMYAIVSVIISSKAIDMVTSGLMLSKMAVIVSDKSDDIADAILKSIGRGVTFLHGQGAYTKSEKNVLLCVFAQKQTVAITDIVKNTDPKSFIIIADANLVLGSGFKKLENDDIF